MPRDILTFDFHESELRAGLGWGYIGVTRTHSHGREGMGRGVYIPGVDVNCSALCPGVHSLTRIPNSDNPDIFAAPWDFIVMSSTIWGRRAQLIGSGLSTFCQP